MYICRDRRFRTSRGVSRTFLHNAHFVKGVLGPPKRGPLAHIELNDAVGIDVIVDFG